VGELTPWARFREGGEDILHPSMELGLEKAVKIYCTLLWSWV